MNAANKAAVVNAIKATLSFKASDLVRLHAEFMRLLDDTDPAELIETLIDECSEGTVVECAIQFSRAVGIEEANKALANIWPRLTSSKRLDIAMTAGYEQAFSDEVWLQVFEDPSNTVHVRHRIVAGLVQSHVPTTKNQLADLGSRIGRYENENQQAILETFRKNFGL